MTAIRFQSRWAKNRILACSVNVAFIHSLARSTAALASRPLLCLSGGGAEPSVCIRDKDSGSCHILHTKEDNVSPYISFESILIYLKNTIYHQAL